MLNSLRLFLSITGRGIYRPMAVMLLLGLVGALMEMIGVSLVFPLIQLIEDPGTLRTNASLWAIYQLFDFSSDRAFIASLGICMAGVFILKNTFMGVLTWIQTGLIAHWKASISTRLLMGYAETPYSNLIGRNSAELIRNVGLSGVCFDAFFANFLSLAINLLMVTGLFTLLLGFQPMMTLVAAGLIMALMALQYKILGPWLIRLGHRATDTTKERQKALQQCLGAMKEVRALGRTATFTEAFARQELISVNNGRRVSFAGALPPLVTETCLMLALLGVIAVALLGMDQPGAVLSSLGLLAMSAFRLMPLFNRTLISMNAMNHARSALQIVAAEVARLPEGTPAAEEDVRRLDFTREIRLEGVGYRYPNADKAALRDLNVVIRKGESIGLVGASGAGKSTLADLLLGLLAPDTGRISVDGEDVTPILGRWRRIVGYIPQFIYLTDDTLQRNVAFGIRDHQVDDQAVETALRLAQLSDLVDQLPQGIHTPLGELGQRLSGGQRQRVGIARALYHSPDVLVMDEATSALDVETENQISETIRRFHGLKTIIIIAHRLSTIRHCDRLFFMSNGRIVDVGTFEELRRRNPEFDTLVHLSSVFTPSENTRLEGESP